MSLQWMRMSEIPISILWWHVQLPSPLFEGGGGDIDRSQPLEIWNKLAGDKCCTQQMRIFHPKEKSEKLE